MFLLLVAGALVIWLAFLLSAALTMVGSLGYYRMLESIYGEKPLGVDDDRVLAVWVDACMAIAERFGLDKRKPARTD